MVVRAQWNGNILDGIVQYFRQIHPGMFDMLENFRLSTNIWKWSPAAQRELVLTQRSVSKTDSDMTFKVQRPPARRFVEHMLDLATLGICEWDIFAWWSRSRCVLYPKGRRCVSEVPPFNSITLFISLTVAVAALAALATSFHLILLWNSNHLFGFQWQSSSLPFLEA